MTLYAEVSFQFLGCLCGRRDTKDFGPLRLVGIANRLHRICNALARFAVDTDEGIARMQDVTDCRFLFKRELRPRFNCPVDNSVVQTQTGSAN